MTAMASDELGGLLPGALVAFAARLRPWLAVAALTLAAALDCRRTSAAAQ
jgi:hypothetical protein